jgi:hypothetical protein
MHVYENPCRSHARTYALEQGKADGAKPPFRPKHVWSIRTKLQLEGRIRDLAMFNLAIDSKLRGCDVVALRVEDIAPNGYNERSGYYPAEENWTVCQVRADGTN